MLVFRRPQTKRPSSKDRMWRIKTKKKKAMRGGKAAADPQAVQRGRLRSAALSVWFSSRLFRGVCLSLPSTRHSAKLFFAHQSNQESV